ncbi:carbamoyl phosphate synthase small subunit [Planococcus lenghuensis]|uniref:Carbamoyl phosphate synthase small chain n=1 Tax=Planococcus lenghuensis TaxID=2213202 RepID=A0A1Q2L2P6_9BACL|nr:carbamoyl phosphate synthase small subunit [Planococcus lenghuensis]AQQ54686.1 carbamoyl phosphate synthase small subunit [Planococcus lenghuensis]
MEEITGYLVLSTGDVLEGKWLGDTNATEGEVVFNTAMTGYQEVMTDPSYAGQIVAMTYPLIGNYGFSDLDFESLVPSLAGLIISHPCRTPNHFQQDFTLEDMINRYHIPALYDIDTRALTRIIRSEGEVYGRITSDPEAFPVQQSVDPELVRKVSIQETATVSSKSGNWSELSDPHVVVYDFGCKHSITHTLAELGCRVTIVPFDTAPDVVDSLQPDGIVLSNGPGNPADLAHLTETIKKVTDTYPTLGICLGHQLIALSHGGRTERLPYGHRGSNHPVKDLTTGKVFITSQNHGYVVDMESVEPDQWQISHVNVNDRSVEGLMHRTKPVMGVQFHPEAHPGPVDTYGVFTDFLRTIPVGKEKRHA